MMTAFSQLASPGGVLGDWLSDKTGGWLAFWQLLLLAVVIGLIFFLRWYKRRQM